MKFNNNILKFNTPSSFIIPTILIVVMVSVRYFGSYLVFHTFTELFTIFVAMSIAFVSYYTYTFTKNRYLLFLGLGYFWIGLLDILHTQTYPGMNIYDIEGMDITLTLWILTRFFEAMIFLLAPVMRNRNFSIRNIMLIFGLYSLFTVLFSMYSPLMLFDKDSGLSLLKIVSEYGIILILLGALKLNSIKKSEFHTSIYKAIQIVIVFTIIAEVFLTFYTDAYGFTNLLGHIFKFLSFWVLFVVLIKTSIQEPIKLMAKEASSYNAIPVPAVIVSNDGVIRQVNEAAEKYLGLNSEQIIEHSNHELFHPSDLTVLECPICQAIQNKQAIHELELTDTIRHRVIQYSLSFIEVESQRGTIQVCIDVTKMHEDSEEIKKLKERMELALLGYNAGVYEWNMLDNSAYYSPQWKEMVGYDSGDELPAHLSTWKDRVHPDDIEAIMSNVQAALDAKEEHIETVHRLKHRNGQWIWILGRGIIQYDEHGKAFRMVGIHTDISEQKALQLKSAHQAQIIEQINDSVTSMGLDGTIMSWNSGSERLSGYRADEVIGKHISMLHRPEDMPALEKAIATLMETGMHNMEVYLVKKSKDIISVSIYLSLLRDENGVPLNIIGYAHDITERKKAEEALLKQRDRLDEKVHEQVLQLREKENLLMEQSKLAQMGDMISMIAHQWRQPLNVVSIKAIKLSLMSERNDLPTQKVEEISKTIQQQVQEMSMIIDDFMNFNKRLDDELFLLSTAVKDTLNIITTQLKSRGIHVDVDIDKELKVFHNQKSIDHSLLNLLVNARDAFEAHPEIENRVIKIYTKELEDRIELIVEDNAGGIPKNIRHKVFNPYFTTKEQGKGTGIGLYMVKNLIEKVKGSSIHLKVIDNGSCFTIRFEKGTEA